MNLKSSVFTIGAVLFLSGCRTTVGSPQNLIVGKWEVENAPLKMTAEFRPDGTAEINMFGQPARGTYKITDGNELVWTMNGITTTAKLSVNATELEVTNDQNQTVKYQRK